MLESFCSASFRPIVTLKSMRWMSALVAAPHPRGRAYYALERRGIV